MNEQATRHPFPDLPVLRARLRDGLAEGRGVRRRISSIERTEVDRPGKFYASEVLRIAFEDCSSLQVFAKHGPLADVADEYRGGLCGGLGYERRAHCAASAIAPQRVPRLLGHARHGPDASLFFEFVAGAVPLTRIRPQDEALLAAAAWLGRFHRDGRQRSGVNHGPNQGLNTIDRSFLAPWADRACAMIDRLAASLTSGEPDLFRRIERAHADDIAVLEAPDRTLLHGDLFPNNIVGSGSSLRVLDWEMAAYGPGELDLAMLTFGWPAETVTACCRAYAGARWPNAEPASFVPTFAAARRFVLLRIVSVAPPANRLERYEARVRQLAGLLGIDSFAEHRSPRLRARVQ